MPDGSIKPTAISDSSLTPTLDYFNKPKFQVEFNGSCLKADMISFTPDEITNLHIVFETKSWPFCSDNGSILRKSLFVAVKLSSNPDPDKYSYSGWSILFDVCGTFSLPNSEFG